MVRMKVSSNQTEKSQTKLKENDTKCNKKNPKTNKTNPTKTTNQPKKQRKKGQTSRTNQKDLRLSGFRCWVYFRLIFLTLGKSRNISLPTLEKKNVCVVLWSFMNSLWRYLRYLYNTCMKGFSLISKTSRNCITHHLVKSNVCAGCSERHRGGKASFPNWYGYLRWQFDSLKNPSGKGFGEHQLK